MPKVSMTVNGNAVTADADARTLLVQCLPSVVVPRLVPMLEHDLLHLLRVEPDERVERDDPAGGLRMRGAVRERDHAAVRVTEHVEALLAEMDSQLLDVRDVIRRRVRALVVGR